VNFGRLAAGQGASAEVKKFGQQMVDDHSKANDDLNKIADAKRITPAPRMDAKHSAAFDKLATLRGADFDKEYIAGQIADHKEAVALFEAEAKNGKDEDLKAFAAKALPTIKAHLDAAQKLTAGGAEKEKAGDKEKEKEPIPTPKSETTEGKYGEYKDGKLTVRDKEDKEKTFDVKGVKPTFGGEEGKWDDFKKGDKVTVTTDKDGKVTKVEGPKFAPPPPPKVETFEGKYTEFKDDKLTIAVGDKDKAFDVKGVKAMIDGKEGKWDDVKKDAKVKVTTTDGKVTKVEATNPAVPPDEFASVEGKFVQYKDDNLTFSVDGKDKTLNAKGVKPLIDGKDGKWDDLKKDDKITITMLVGGKVTKVELKGAPPPPPPPPPDKAATADGKFVGYADDKLTLSVDGKDKAFDVKGVKPQIDGKDGKWDDFKKDDKVTVTTDKDGKVTKVEKK
jgi:predicted outer membrane protein